MNLLVFKVNQLGDNIVFVSVVQELRRMFPQAGLTLFTSPEAAPLYGGPFAPTTVLTARRSTFNGSWRTPLTFSSYWWKAHKAHAKACLLSGDQGSVAHLLGIVAVPTIRVGSAELNIRVPSGLTHKVYCPPGSKIAAWNWEMGRALAVALNRYDWPMKMLPPDLSHLITPRPRERRRILVHAGASVPYRRWPLDSFVLLAERLGRDHDVVWVDRAETRDASFSPNVNRVECDALPDLASWIASSDLFVGNHSGPLQLASALGVPGVVLSGPTHPEWDPPWKPNQYLILRTPGLACLPCERHGVAPLRCTNTAEPMACMARWSVEVVEQKCREWIAKWGTSAAAEGARR
jgi:ADP-heptose:LPS heptosyltransferase